jgi:hypothetical protein
LAAGSAGSPGGKEARALGGARTAPEVIENKHLKTENVINISAVNQIFFNFREI